MQLVRTAGTKLVVQSRTIGTTAENISQGNLETPLQNGVRVKADAGNGDNIYIGDSDTVSTTDGFPLDAGEEVFIPIDELGKVWVIGGAIDQDFHIIAS